MVKFSLVATVAALALAVPAQAATFFLTPGSAASFAGPAGVTTTFNGGSVAPGFTLTGTGSIVNGDLAGQYAEPAFSDASDYLAVLGGTTATLQGMTGYEMVSAFVGSIDGYNSIDLLDTMGNVIQSFGGAAFGVANGDQTSMITNQRITFERSAGDALIGGIRFNSDANSIEVDNVVFAIPEPSTWLTMILGFGLVGFASRARRRKALGTVHA